MDAMGKILWKLKGKGDSDAAASVEGYHKSQL